MNVCIHVGLPKTGTTFMQDHFFGNLNLLYITSKNAGSAYPFFQKWMMDFLSTHSAQVSGSDIKLFRKKLSSAMRDGGYSKTLVSAEELVGTVAANFMDSLDHMRKLHMFFEQPKILLFIRRQDTFLESLYRYTVMNGFHSSVEHFLNWRGGSFESYRHGARINLSVHTLNWDSIIKSYEDEFGAENVKVMVYEDFLADNIGTLKEVCAFLGVAFPGLPKRKKANKSLGSAAILTMRFLNKFVNNGRNGFFFIVQNPLAPFLPLIHKNEKPIVSYLRKLSESMLLKNYVRPLDWVFPHNKKIISSEMRTEIMKLHAEGNRRISERLSLNLDKYDYF